MPSSASSASIEVVADDGARSECPEVLGEAPKEDLEDQRVLEDVEVVETQAKTVDVDPHGEACSHCTREFAVASMVNYGCKAYPKWRCKACHTACRAIERSAKSKGEAYYAKFCEQRRQRPKLFSDLILGVRISQEGEQPLPYELEKIGASGLCSSLSDRKERVTRIVEFMYSDKGTEEYEDLRWMSERQFKAHKKYKEDMSAAEAQSEHGCHRRRAASKAWADTSGSLGCRGPAALPQEGLTQREAGGRGN